MRFGILEYWLRKMMTRKDMVDCPKKRPPQTTTKNKQQKPRSKTYVSTYFYSVKDFVLWLGEKGEAYIYYQ